MGSKEVLLHSLLNSVSLAHSWESGGLPVTTKGRFTMPRSTIVRKVLLSGLLTVLFASQAGTVSAGTNVWTSIGPEGGRILALAIDPAAPSTIYAGTWGGVFKSTNGGAAWSAVNTGLTNTDVYALAIDPVTPSMLYAGTWGGGVFAIQPLIRIFLPIVLRGQ